MNDRDVLNGLFVVIDRGVEVIDDHNNPCIIGRVDMPDDKVVIETTDGAQYEVTVKQVHSASQQPGQQRSVGNSCRPALDCQKCSMTSNCDLKSTEDDGTMLVGDLLRPGGPT